MWVSIILLLVIIFLLIILSMVWPPDSPWAPWWRTTDEKIRIALKLAKVRGKDVVYDLGCGDGRVLTIAAKEFGARGVGIEIDPLRFLLSKVLVKFHGVSGRIKIVRGNFFEEDISEATVVFLYLIPKTLEKLKPKLLKELKKGTRIITVRYAMSLKKIGEDTTDDLFVYTS